MSVDDFFDTILFGLFVLAVIAGVTYASNLTTERTPEDLIERPAQMPVK